MGSVTRLWSRSTPFSGNLVMVLLLTPLLYDPPSTWTIEMGKLYLSLLSRVCQCTTCPVLTHHPSPITRHPSVPPARRDFLPAGVYQSWGRWLRGGGLCSHPGL